MRGDVARRALPSTIIFFLPSRSVRMPPGSWKTSWAMVSAMKIIPIRVLLVPSSRM
jgi:hypothetical protein